MGDGWRTRKDLHLEEIQTGSGLVRSRIILLSCHILISADSIKFMPVILNLSVQVQCANKDVLAGWCESGSIFVADVQLQDKDGCLI